jgi:hypothetical protein
MPILFLSGFLFLCSPFLCSALEFGEVWQRENGLGGDLFDGVNWSYQEPAANLYERGMSFFLAYLEVRPREEKYFIFFELPPVSGDISLFLFFNPFSRAVPLPCFK